MRNSIKIEIKNTSYDMYFTLRGISQDEFKQLSKEFNPKSYQNYEGVLLPWKVWEGNEIVFYIGDKFKAVELIEHKNTFHPPCHESAPFLLNDGRVLLLSLIHI